MNRVVLTDRMLKALKAPGDGKRRDHWDAVVPGLGVQVTATGSKTFILLARFPGGNKRKPESKNPTRRRIGRYGAVTLEKARITARDWHELLRRGIDPKEEEARIRAAEKEKRGRTFERVVEDFIREKLSTERTGSEAERNIRRDLIPVWGDKPLSEISELDVVEVIKSKKLTAPRGARNLLADIKRFFSWVIDQRIYGLSVSPAVNLKAGKIVGEKVAANRILNDDELFALWRAAIRMGYPHGTVYMVLILTALRLNEAADASWPEFNEKAGEWIIPASRMKALAGRERPHAVPLTRDLCDVLSQLPKFSGENAGPYLFSTCLGRKPVWMTSKIKDDVDARMLRTLRALARMRGRDPSQVTLPKWTNHDIRRTVRSGLPRLKVQDSVAEAILAHVKPGIQGVYNLYEYFDEKREALELWSTKVHSLGSGKERK